MNKPLIEGPWTENGVTWGSITGRLSCDPEIQNVKRGTMSLKCWTDGSCLGNPGSGGWAVVWQDGIEIAGGESHTTNNRMELTAILAAIKSAPPHEDIIIHSDSQWAIKVLTGEWMAKKNLDLIDQVFNLPQPKSLQYVWVKGHSGVSQNERADKLAVMAAQEVQRRGRFG